MIGAMDWLARVFTSHDATREAYWRGWNDGVKYALARVEEEISEAQSQGSGS